MDRPYVFARCAPRMLDKGQNSLSDLTVPGIGQAFSERTGSMYGAQRESVLLTLLFQHSGIWRCIKRAVALCQ